MAKILTYQKSEFENLLPSDWSILLGTVRQVAASQNVPLYIVGGFVRDLLLGQPGSDFDLVVEGDAIGLAKSAAARYGGRVTSHGRFGTAKWLLADSSLNARLSRPLPALDFVLARSESYAHPGALPTVQPGTLSDDLRRRDFSINTLAIRLDGQHYGELRDDLGGLEDLHNGLVRVLHPLSFVDDPTRMLRAVRYEQRYDFRIPASDLELIPPARHLLAKLSADRIRHELNLILGENKAGDILARTAELNLLASIHPSLPWDADLQRAIESGLVATPPKEWGRLPDLAPTPRRVALGYLLWLLRLSHEDIEALDFRLHFPAELREAVQAAASVWRDLAEFVNMKPSQAFDRLAEIQPLAVFACYLESGREGREILDRFMASWRHVRPRTSGNDLIALGLPPGPLYQTILRSLRDAWLDGEVKTVEEEHSLLTRLIEKDGENSH